MATLPEDIVPLDRDPGTPAPSAAPFLADQAQQLADRQRFDFVSTLQNVNKINPDTFSKVSQVSKASGIDPTVLLKHNEEMSRLLEGNEYAALYDTNRKTAQAVADGQTAALAHDDLENLSRIETAAQVTRFNDQSQGEKLWSGVKQGFQQEEQGSNLSYADKLERLKGQFDSVDQEVTAAALEGREPYTGDASPTKPIGFAQDYLNLPPEDRVAMRTRLLGNQANAITDSVQTQKELDAAPVEPGALRSQQLGGDATAMASAIAENPGYAVRAGISGIATSVPMLVAGAIGGPLAAGVVDFGTQSDTQLLNVLRAGKVNLDDPKAVLEALQDDDFMTKARAAATRGAGASTAIDVLSMGLAGKLLVPSQIAGKAITPLAREGINAAAQIPVQGGLAAASTAAGQAASGQDVNGGDVFMAAVSGGAMSSVEIAAFGREHIAQSIQDGLRQSRQAKQAKVTLDQMAAAAVDSKVRARGPAGEEAFNNVTTQQLADTPFETISIPAEALTSLNQDGVPPVLDDLMAKVPGMAAQYADALARGGSVTMKAADYLTAFAEHHDQLSNSIRTQVDGMSVDESKVWQDAQAEQINKLAESLKEPPSATDDAFVGLMSELQQAGYRRSDAEQYAALHISALSTLADRTGKPINEIMARFPLDIRNKAPEALQRVPVDDVRLALQRLRTGDIPQPRDMFGKSLVEYLRDAGGVNDAGGELAALDANVGKVGRNRISRKEGGLSLDDAAMHAWERGYFPGVPRDEVGPQLIIDAVQRDLNDQPTFSSENENATLRDQAVNLQQLKDYLDQLGVNIDELTDDQVINILKNPEQIDGVKLNQSGSAAEPRGYIDFTPKNGDKQRQFAITVTGRRDLSTLLHEFGHFYLEVVSDLASDADAPQQIKDDVATIRQWTGAEEAGPFSVEQHEQFARGFESYLSEGKAPNPELQGAFSRFKRWIISIYKDLKRLNVNLSPEVRAVMDRIVATDDQIRAAEQVTQAIPLFPDATKAGMTDAEYLSYRNAIEAAHDDAATTVEQQIIREEERRNSKDWADERLRIAKEVNDELDTVPAYQATKALRTGVMPDGSVQDIKLNSAQLKEQYGQAVVRKLAFMHKREGLPSDVVAQMLGFDSGDAMIKDILSAPPRSEVIKSEVEQRMFERHGTKADGASTEKAIHAVHNEKRGEVLLRELNALGKQGNRKNITSQQVLKAAAQRIMQELKVRDIQPFEYQRAEGMAGRRAFDAASKGDLATAYQAKQQQLLNYHLWKQADAARTQIDSIVKRMADFNKSTRREKLGKAGHDYLDQIDAIMEQYEFRNVSLRAIDKRKSFAQWYTEQLAAGNEPDVPEFVLASSEKTNYKELSLSQLDELDDFAQNVNHLAGLKNKLLANKRKTDFKAAVVDLDASARNNNAKRPPLPLDKSTMTAMAKMGNSFGDLSASLMKMEQVIEWLDGGDIDGAWHQTFWQPFVDAQIRENDINRSLTTQLMKNITAHQKVNGPKALQERTHIPEIQQTFTKNAILAVALNVGNAGNREKLVRGHGWNESQLQAVLKHMNKADWEFVQAQWDLVGSLWPDIVELEKSVHGTAPEKVEHLAVDTPHGQFSGGYWPLVYDQSSPAFAGVLGTLTDGQNLYDTTSGRATTPRGHTKARVDGFAAPLILDSGIIAQHLGQVVHDLTHRLPIMDAAKIIGDPTIKRALIDTVGQNIANQFNPWLRGVANDRSPQSQAGLSSWAKLMNGMAANLSIAWMGFSATTGVQQILGFSQSLEHLAQTGGRAYLFKGMGQFIKAPNETAAWIKSVSGEMRNRDQNLDNNIREAINKSVGKTGSYAVMQRLAFKFTALVQSLVDNPTWLAGYHQAIDAGESHDIAINQGDRAVRLSQMSSGAKDLSAIQRQQGVMKPFTIVYSYFNLLFNREADLVRSMKNAQGVTDYLAAFERTAYLLLIPAVLSPLVSGQGPKDDESYAKWAALNVLTYPLMSIPLVRDGASALESGFGYNGATPIGDAVGSTVRLAGQVGGLIDKGAKDDTAEKVTLQVMDTLGLTLGLPTAQPKRTVKYLFHAADGTAPSADVSDWVRGIIFGPPKTK